MSFKKRCSFLLFVLAVVALASAQAQVVPLPVTSPPITINGVAQQSVGINAGDANNGATAVSSTSGLFAGSSTSPTTHLSGVANSAGHTNATSSLTPTQSQSTFAGDGSANAKLNLGKATGTTGTITIIGNVSGLGISNLGDCTTGSCAGALGLGNAGANLTMNADNGRIGANLNLTTEGLSWANLSPTSASAGSHVSAGAGAATQQKPPTTCNHSGT